MWGNAKLILNSHGWKRSKKLEKALDSVFDFESEDLDRLDFAKVVTIGRDEDFHDEVRKSVKAVTKKANGRQVFWVNDPTDEWYDVILFFGEENDLVGKIESWVPPLPVVPTTNDLPPQQSSPNQELPANIVGDSLNLENSGWVRFHDTLFPTKLGWEKEGLTILYDQSQDNWGVIASRLGYTLLSSGHILTEVMERASLAANGIKDEWEKILKILDSPSKSERS